jgi:phosphate transport system ATP-binding protein
MTTMSATCAAPDGCCDLVLDGLGLRYGATWAFRHVDLRIHSCAITAIVGPSGCGKSSLLTCLNRLDALEPTAHVTGSVRWGGRDLRAPGTDLVALRRRIGMLFQRPAPFPLSIRANIELPLAEHGCRQPRERADRCEAALRSVGLWDEVADRLDARATTLSGGQQQRLCLARVLALAPEVLLMDEPCSALDPLAAEIIDDLIAGLRGFYTVVLVTHDLDQARRLADHLVVLWPGPDGGSIALTGSPADVAADAPHQHPRLRRYLGVPSETPAQSMVLGTL